MYVHSSAVVPPVNAVAREPSKRGLMSGHDRVARLAVATQNQNSAFFQECQFVSPVRAFRRSSNGS
jgi:hypothetical protein